MTYSVTDSPQVVPGGFAVSSFKVALTVLLLFVLPATIAYAGFFSLFDGLFTDGAAAPSRTLNSQNVSLLAAASPMHAGGSTDPDPSDASIGVIGDSALYAESGPEGSMADVVGDETPSGHIALYVVREGDSYASIAKMFGVSVNTILWANNLTKGSALKVGQELVILPISGVQHTVKKGDTLLSIAKKYKGDVDEISRYNGLAADAVLALGDTVIIPDGEIPAAPAPRIVSASSKLRGVSGPVYSGYYAAPMSGYRKTQGLHGYNGVDLASYLGAPVMAAAEGDVIIARQGGYNGGYGSYVVIRHDNGTQTLYGHLQAVLVSAGDHVAKGQQIGKMGNSGRSTGPHLHFEVRGARNPF